MLYNVIYIYIDIIITSIIKMMIMIIVLEGFHLNPQHPQDVHGLAASRFPTQKPDISTSSPLFPDEPPGWWLTYPSEKYESQLG